MGVDKIGSGRFRLPKKTIEFLNLEIFSLGLKRRKISQLSDVYYDTIIRPFRGDTYNIRVHEAIWEEIVRCRQSIIKSSILLLKFNDQKLERLKIHSPKTNSPDYSNET